MSDISNGQTSRRDFVKTSLLGLGAITILPSKVISGLGHIAPSDKLNIAGVGIGGRGFRNLNNLKNENIVALCDVDAEYGEKSFRRWGAANKYTDFRVMLDKENSLDALVIATPDHTHAVIAMMAMKLQKHVFVQTPAAHAVFEIRRMVETARVYDVVSQCGNQGASGDNTRDIAEIIWSGAIGEVREVHAWTSEPQWKQGVRYPEKPESEPRTLNWELFLGPTEYIPYHPVYTPYGWRAWWKFGNGAPGAIGPHLLEPVFRALKLNAPVEIEASSTALNLESAPVAQKIRFHFERRKNLPQLAMPAVNLYWYDGGLKPELPGMLPFNLFETYFGGGVVFIGSDGFICCGVEGDNYKLILNNKEIVPPITERIIHRVDGSVLGHEADWARACKESTNNRLNPSASFESQAALNETILTGNIAVRLQSFGRVLKWDSAQMKFTNIDPYDEIAISENKGLFIENGIPKFNISEKRTNALHFADQLIRPIYREGWQQI
ncbi:MAG: Gfo/Idh/MocA family oxidoreductase [Prolixibacteraceae bacterium]|nr:Gfo/Idh/MocA family oxidoreductase [Prolixibacteraceae bacterium]